MRINFFYLLTALLCAFPSQAEKTLADAEKLYAEGQFENARLIYRTHAHAPAQPANFYYNFGTAALRAGAVGEAYVVLRRASLAAPFDADARSNLRIAQKKLPASAAATRPAGWLSWWPDGLRWIPWQAWICVGLLLIAPAAWAAKSELLPWHWALGLAGLFLLAGGALAGWQGRFDSAGIIQGGKVFSGPGKTYPEITSIESGSLVSIEESRDGWFKIRYLDSRLQETVGWVEEPTALKLEGGT